MTEEQLDELYKIVFLTDSGRVVLDDICKMCGITSLSYNPNDANKQITFFYEGKKSIAFNILSRLGKLDNQYLIQSIDKEY